MSFLGFYDLLTPKAGLWGDFFCRTAKRFFQLPFVLSAYGFGGSSGFPERVGGGVVDSPSRSRLATIFSRDAMSIV